MTRLQMNLIENSNSFLIEAIKKMIDSRNNINNWKYAILMLVQAIELSLKEKLRNEHPIIIYTNIDKPKHTVSIEVARNRIKNICKVDFTSQENKAINNAINWRNKIIHFEFEINISAIKATFVSLFGFLSDFNRKHFNQEMKDILPKDLWNEVTNIKDYEKELLDRAYKRIEEENIDYNWIWSCRECGNDTFILQDDINTCYFCGNSEEIKECDRCKKMIYQDNIKEIYTGNYKGLDNWDIVCEDCYEENEAYQNMLSEMQYYS